MFKVMFATSYKYAKYSNPILLEASFCMAGVDSVFLELMKIYLLQS